MLVPNIPVDGKDTIEYMKNHIFELHAEKDMSSWEILLGEGGGYSLIWAI